MTTTTARSSDREIVRGTYAGAGCVQTNVSAHAWFAEVDWSDLASGVMDSPLRATARTQLAARLSEGAAELEYDGMYEPGADEAWMGGFDAQK